MKSFSVFSFAAFVHLVASSGVPLLQFDPNTTKDCAEWHNVADGGETCEYIRRLYGISPAEFHEWNPLVGLDCTPWWDWQSYCIVTQKKLDSVKTTTPTPSATISSTTTALSLGPSPTAWDPIGCYAQNPVRSILEQNMTPNGDGALTIPKCKLTCYRRAYKFAGVLQGNQCWCSNYVAGEWAKNQTDCSAPCAGDKSTVCGGTGVFNVFEALANKITVVTNSASPVMAAASSNGAMSNRAMFGMEF